MSDAPPEDQAITPQPGRLAQFAKRFAVMLGVLLLLLAIFHRQIFFHGTRYFIIQAAKKQHIDLTYEMDGTIFTGLTIRNLRATATAAGPVEHITISTVAVQYSFPGLIRKGLPGFLDTVRISGADIALNSTGKAEKPKGPRKAFKIPALFPRELAITDLNLVIHQEKQDLELRGFTLTLNPDQPGTLTFDKLALPGIHTWTDVSATTSFLRRNLILRDLTLDPHIQIAKLNLDASELDQGILGLALDASLFGGQIDLQGQISDLNASNHINLEALILAVSLDQAGDYFRPGSSLAGLMKNARVRFNGPLENPSRWSGSTSLQIDHPAFKAVGTDSAGLDFTLKNGELRLNLTASLTDENEVAVSGSAKLPTALNKLLLARATGQAHLDARALAAIKLPTLQIESGKLNATAPFTLENGILASDITVSVQNLESDKVGAGNGTFDIKLRKDLKPPPSTQKASPFSGLAYSMMAKIAQFRFSDYKLDSLTVDAAGEKADLDLRQLSAVTGANKLTASGTATLPSTAEEVKTTPLSIEFKVEAPDLNQFLSDHATAALQGKFRSEGTLRRESGKLNGHLTLNGNSLEVRGVKAESIAVNTQIVDNTARVRELNLRFDDNSHVTAAAEISLIEPYPYSGSLEAQLPKLSLFEPALRHGAEKMDIAGSLALNWQGRGSLKKVQHDGSIDLSLNDGRFGDLKNIKAVVAGTYSPEVVELPGIRFVSSRGSVTADITLRDRRLTIANLSIAQPQGAAVTGNIQLPVDLSNPGDVEDLLPDSEELSASLVMKETPISSFLKTGDRPPPVRGNVEMRLSAGGTLKNLQAELKSQLTQVKFEAAPDLGAAEADIAVRFAEGTLALDSRVQVPGIQPLTVKGSIPLSVPELLRSKHLSTDTPVELIAALPSSSVDWINRVFPLVRYIEGRIALDAKVQGTLAKPEISGSANLSLPALRFSDQNLPSVNGFQAAITLSGQKLTLSQFSGVLAGGTFALTGGATLEPLTNPTLDLTFRSNNALVVRNETLTVRVNSNVKVQGPLNGAAVTGFVALTNSRFFREIDILPIELPGRPAPKPPAETAGFSFTSPPLRDWKFDLAITTADPFLVRGNLADGAINIDLKLVGTGETPALDGTIRITDFTASLPFSRLQVSRGYVYFSPDDPFVPVLDIQGLSNIRNYRISVYISGDATHPQTEFSSQPPLPQEDIISLLATGTTTQELTGSSDALAGRAAVLLFQKLSRMVFKKKPPASKSGSVFDRFEVDVGTVDPKTGRQELEARFRLADQLYLIGDLDVQGDVRGQVKYLLRFR